MQETSPSAPEHVQPAPADSSDPVAKVEFDAYADGYGAGMDNGLKRLVGKSADTFLRIKARWLCRFLARYYPPQTRTAPLQLLDYGCGVAAFLRHLKQLGFTGELRGCDISRGMLREAERAWDLGPLPPLDWVADAVLPYRDEQFDVVVACAVLHHVPLEERPAVYRQIARVLRPGGLFVLFEHNPYNPVTQWVVRHTPIDQNAVLLSARAAQRSVRAAGLAPVRTEYMMFFPPRWQWLTRAEDLLGWLPFGGQYALVAGKPGRL
jgi:SAM-dependent methyltransferase